MCKAVAGIHIPPKYRSGFKLLKPLRAAGEDVMSLDEATEYFDTLTDAQKIRFNLLTDIGLKLGKPIQGAYLYAKTMLEVD